MAKITRKPSKHKPDTKIGTFYAWLKKYKKLPAWNGLIPLTVFLVLTLPAGLFLIFNVPAMWAPDGGAHVARAFQIAEGGVRSVYINHNHGVGYGGAIPTNVNDLKNYELDIIGRSPAAPGQQTQGKLITKQDRQGIARISSQKVAKERVMISYVNTAAYSPMAYAPNVVGLVVGMKLNFNLGHTLLLSRLCSFLAFLVCVGYALYTLRKSGFKWIVLATSLLPLVIFQSTVITADSFLISVSILFAGLILKSLSSGLQLTLVDKILLYTCAVLLPLLKSVYFLLAFCVLLVPRRQWSNPRRYWIWAGSALAIAMIAFGIWAHLTTDVANSNGLVRGDTLWAYGDANIQKAYLIGHPFKFVQVLFDCMLYASKTYMDNFFGWIGFTYLAIPGAAMVAGYLSLGLSVLLAGSVRFRKRVTALLLAIVVLTGVIIFATLYLYYTLPKNSVVEGVQGRYFLPLTVLFLGSIAALFPKMRIAPSGLTNAKIALTLLAAFCFTLSILSYGLAITT